MIPYTIEIARLNHTIPYIEIYHGSAPGYDEVILDVEHGIFEWLMDYRDQIIARSLDTYESFEHWYYGMTILRNPAASHMMFYDDKWIQVPIDYTMLLNNVMHYCATPSEIADTDEEYDLCESQIIIPHSNLPASPCDHTLLI